MTKKLEKLPSMQRDYMGPDETKPVLKPVSSATETSYTIEISLLASLDMIISN